MFIKLKLLLLSLIVFAGTPLISEAANLADYTPLGLGSYWTYQNAANASDTYTVSVFEQFIFNGFNGQPAVKFGIDSNDYNICYNNGTSVSIYAVSEEGIIFGTSIGNFTDGAFFNLVDPTNFALLRMYDNLDPTKSVYGVNDPNLVLWAVYDSRYPKNSQNSIVESNLGITLPDYAVTGLEWYAQGVGEIVRLDIDAASGTIGTRYELIAHNIVAGPVCTQSPAGDLNNDCKVDFEDFAIFADSWLECNTDIPSAPTGVTATAGDGQVSISWSAVSGATSYNIYWSTTSGVTKTNGTKITDATRLYSHTGLTNGTTYYYIVTAVNSSGESVESAQVSATPVGTQVGTAFPIANTSGREMSASAAFDGTNFLVGIQGDATADPSITAQFVSKTGALVGSRISTGNRGGAPFVAFDGTNYLLAWGEDVTYSTKIFGQLVSTSGAIVGAHQFTIASGNNIKSSMPTIFDGTNYFVAWHNESTPGQGDTRDAFGQFITPSGATLGSVIPISTAAQGQRDPAIAFDGTNILAVWTDGRNQRACYTDGNGTHCYESDVYGQFITKSGDSAAGTLSGGNFLINAGTLPRDNPTGIGFDGTNYLVTFIEQTAFDGPIWEAYGILVTKTGATIGSKFVIGNTATNHKMFPGPTYLGTKYLVTWTDGFGTTSASIKGIYVTTSGTVEGSEFTLFSPSSTGAVPWAGGVFTGGGVNLAITNWGIPNMTDPYNMDIYTSEDVMGAIITTP